ncbi:MAG: hypothetical protein ACTHY4_01120 [Flavobacteriaceae bacterium]|nr:hypothetical protein [Psychroflexus sp.]
MRILFLLIGMALISCQSAKNKPMTETVCQKDFHCEKEIEEGQHLVEMKDGTGAVYLKTRPDTTFHTMRLSVNSNDPNLAFAADLKSYQITLSYPAKSKEMAIDEMALYIQTFCKCEEAGVAKLTGFEISSQTVNAAKIFQIRSPEFSFLKEQTLVLKLD